MRRLALAALMLGGAGGVLAVAACSSTSEVAESPGLLDGGSSSEGGQPRPDGGISDAGAVLDADAIVLVHAASFPAFRICFAGASNELPQPSVELMPESNLVGLDVGTALRLPARGSMIGKAFVFRESDLRPLYTLGIGPTCDTLLKGAMKSSAVAVGEVTESLARGVHALVLGGCLGSAADPVASPERCGDDWDPSMGNLALRTLSLRAYPRLDGTRLPVQLLQLSPSLDRRAAGRALGIAFGSLAGSAEAGAGDAPFPLPLVEGAVPFGRAVPDPPAQLDYAEADLTAFESSGVFVTLGGAIDDAGLPVDPGGAAGAARDVVVVQSLADIQRRSSSRSVPPDWFSSASSYLVLSVGELDPRAPDGGPDPDPRRALHLLAVPLATPDGGGAVE